MLLPPPSALSFPIAESCSSCFTPGSARLSASPIVARASSAPYAPHQRNRAKQIGAERCRAAAGPTWRSRAWLSLAQLDLDAKLTAASAPTADSRRRESPRVGRSAQESSQAARLTTILPRALPDSRSSCACTSRSNGNSCAGCARIVPLSKASTNDWERDAAHRYPGRAERKDAREEAELEAARQMPAMDAGSERSRELRRIQNRFGAECLEQREPLAGARRCEHAYRFEASQIDCRLAERRRATSYHQRLARAKLQVVVQENPRRSVRLGSAAKLVQSSDGRRVSCFPRSLETLATDFVTPGGNDRALERDFAVIAVPTSRPPAPQC